MRCSHKTPNLAQQLRITIDDGKMSSGEINVLHLIKKMRESNKFFFSVELIPDANPAWQMSLKESLQELQNNPPLFASVVWNSQHLEISVSENSKNITKVCHPALELIKILQNFYGIPAVMHFSVGSLKEAEVHAILNEAIDAGVRNILALRGDIENGSENPDFPHAADLVHFIRQRFGNTFTVAVAGYPQGHPEASSYTEDLQRLKEKVDRGADLIFAQMILSCHELIHFSKACGQFGINVPIIPGLYIIQSRAMLTKMVTLCKLQLPLKLIQEMSTFQDNADAEKQFGFQQMQKLLQWILHSNLYPGVHFFTLNRIKPVLEACGAVGLFSTSGTRNNENSDESERKNVTEG